MRYRGIVSNPVAYAVHTLDAELLRSRLLVVTLDYFPRPLNRSSRPPKRLIAVQSRVVTGA